MPLKLILRPGEKLIVNGAVIGIGDHAVSLYFYNKVNFLRGREILKEEQCDTLEKKLYFVIQLIYIFPEDASHNLVNFRVIRDEARKQLPQHVEVIDEVSQLVEEGNYYRALKITRRLFPDEPKVDALEEAPTAKARREAAKPPVVVMKNRRRSATADET